MNEIQWTMLSTVLRTVRHEETRNEPACRMASGREENSKGGIPQEFGPRHVDEGGLLLVNLAFSGPLHSYPCQ